MRWSVGLPAFLLAGTAALGATLQVDLQQGESSVVELKGSIDDAHLANPIGYFPPEEPVARVVRRITVENTGVTPIQNPDIRINGDPLLPVSDPLDAMGLRDARDLLALFAKWKDRAVHATTGLDANRDPIAILHVIGAGFCGDDTRALAAITVAHGAEARFARLNGHSVIEHRLGGDWMLLDGDQNLFYLAWDNQTPVSEDDILADPLLALRTQVFGRQSEWNFAQAWQNTSRFEFIDHAREQKPFRLKNVPPKRNWQLLPGEKIAIDLTQTPEQVAAPNDSLRTNATLRAVTCVVKFQTQRHSGEQLEMPYPLISEKVGEPVYEAASPGENVLLCQAARAQFPVLRAGKNRIESKTNGQLRVTFDCDFTDLKSPPVPTVHVELPHLHIEATAAERVWWQIAADSDFHLVPPNLDRVSDFSSKVSLGPIDQTFLSSGNSYFARAKVRRDGVWSDWCKPVGFIVKKPPQPQVSEMEGADGDQIRIRWKPTSGEMLVFGSNRLDFLPEVFGGDEVTHMEEGAVRESRLNRNLLATVSAKNGEAYVPVRACYRLISRDGDLLSVPSALTRTSHPPAATVLQTRHQKNDDAITGRDVAVEMEIP